MHPVSMPTRQSAWRSGSPVRWLAGRPILPAPLLVIAGYAVRQKQAVASRTTYLGPHDPAATGIARTAIEDCDRVPIAPRSLRASRDTPDPRQARLRYVPATHELPRTPPSPQATSRARRSASA